jgi:phage virion morphogenesis protein
MTHELQRLEAWAGALLNKLQPAQRRALARKVATELRRANAKRIAEQVGPDGKPFTARKNRKEFRAKSGRIKRQKAAMFAKLRTAAYLKVEASSDHAAIGFFGKIARVARVHHEGLSDRVAPRGPTYKYPARPLLGFSDSDITLLRESLLHHMESH